MKWTVRLPALAAGITLVAAPVTEDNKAYDEFTGKILKVTVKVKQMGAGVKAQAAKAGADAAKELAAAK